MSNNNRTPWERHFQSAVQILVIGVLVWFGNKTMETSDAVIKLQVEVSAMRLAALSDSADRGKRALALRVVINDRLDRISERVRSLQRERSGLK